MYNAHTRSHTVDFSDGLLFTLEAQPIHIPTPKQSLTSTGMSAYLLNSMPLLNAAPNSLRNAASSPSSFASKESPPSRLLGT
jgi:hypothetical protein